MTIREATTATATATATACRVGVLRLTLRKGAKDGHPFICGWARKKAMTFGLSLPFDDVCWVT
jgi:hypothetical protein